MDSNEIIETKENKPVSNGANLDEITSWLAHPQIEESPDFQPIE